MITSRNTDVVVMPTRDLRLENRVLGASAATYTNITSSPPT